jgi:hypothetical protein
MAPMQKIMGLLCARAGAPARDAFVRRALCLNQSDAFGAKGTWKRATSPMHLTTQSFCPLGSRVSPKSGGAGSQPFGQAGWANHSTEGNWQANRDCQLSAIGAALVACWRTMRQATDANRTSPKSHDTKPSAQSPAGPRHPRPEGHALVNPAIGADGPDDGG